MSSTIVVILGLLPELIFLLIAFYILVRIHREDNRRRQIRIERRKAYFKVLDEEAKRLEQKTKEAALIRRLEERGF